MLFRARHVVPISLFFASFCAGCAPGDTNTKDPPDDKLGSVVLGIRSELTPGVQIDEMAVRILADGKTIVDETRRASDKSLKFPTELNTGDLEEGQLVEATITGTTGGIPSIERLAATKVIANKDLLLEVKLENACTQAPGSSAPTCEVPQTCVKGVCKDSFVVPTKLPNYEANWAEVTVDNCKSQGAGEPIVVVGEGQADYLPMQEGAVAQVEAGPQGGHHIWIALRTKNLTQSGSITSLTGTFPDLGYNVGPFSVVFTFDPDEGGYCKLYGLRFQLDAMYPMAELLGQTFEVTATVTDKDKEVGVGKLKVKLSDDILGG